jgi:hypothetical protein
MTLWQEAKTGGSAIASPPTFTNSFIVDQDPSQYTISEPVTLSIVASTIVIVTLAYNSTKILVEFID